MVTITFKNQNVVSLSGREYTGVESLKVITLKLMRLRSDLENWYPIIEYLYLHLNQPVIAGTKVEKDLSYLQGALMLKIKGFNIIYIRREHD